MSAPAQGPYLVVTREDCAGCGGRGIERYDEGLGELCCVCKGRCVISRRAAADRQQVERFANEHAVGIWVRDDLYVCVNGETITVETATYETLAEAVGYGDAYRAGTFSDQHALAYFNRDASHPVCACGRRALDCNHQACAECIARAVEECPVLDTVAIRYVRGYERGRAQ